MSRPGGLAARHGHWAGLLLLWALAWYFSVRDMDLRIAAGGWSPIDWVYQVSMPENYEKNFPSGIMAYKFSAFMRVYTGAYSWLGVPPEAMMYVVIAFEIGLFGYAVWRLARAIFPEASHLASMTTVIVVLASHADALDLSRFGAAQFYGLYYAVANGLRLLAIVAVLEGRVLRAALLITACAVTHPIEGLIGLAFIGAMFVSQPRRLLDRGVLIGGAIFSVVFGAWFGELRGTGATGGGMPVDQWIALTRAFSFHWYPVDWGLFTVEHQERFVPFLGFLLLFVYYLRRRTPLGESDRRLACGMASMLAMTVFGIAASWMVQVPFLIKLGLHRASLLFYLVAIVYVVHGLWNELRPRPMWRCALALGLIVSTFILKPGFPLVFAMLLTAPAWGEAARARLLSPATGVVTVASCSGALLIFYATQGWLGSWSADAYSGGKWILGFTAITWLMLATTRFFPYPGLSDQGVVYLGALSAIGIAAVASLAYPTVRGSDFPARAYKEAQIWARQSSPPTALFMVDPAISYGWRDYSRRSSFGNLREWVVTTWLYDSSVDRFNEGLSRAGLFRVDLFHYTRDTRPPYGALKLTDEVRRQYYESSCDWRLDAARRYHIDFFVFRTDFPTYRPCFPAAYRNDSFVIERVR